MQVTHLFVKQQEGAPMQAVTSLSVVEGKIHGSIACAPLRQVLLLSRDTLDDFHLAPGDLCENIVVNGVDIHSLPSGTLVRIGSARIRLTLHCEPCKRIASLVNLRAINHRRGYLGNFVHDGLITVADAVTVLDQRGEAIPENITERMHWFLSQRNTPIFAADLVWELGLARAYCRSVRRLAAALPEAQSRKILYAKDAVRLRALNQQANLLR